MPKQRTVPYGLRATPETRELIWRYLGSLQAKAGHRVTIDEALQQVLREALARQEESDEVD